MFNTKELSSISKSIGLAMIFCGLPIGMYLNYFIVDLRWSDIVMFSGVFLTINYRNILRLEFPSFSREMQVLILFQCLCLVSLFITSNHFNPKYLFFHLFVISIQVALMTNNAQTINPKYTIISSWIISSICALTALYALKVGLIGDYEENDEAQKNNILERFTMSSGCFVCLVSSLVASTYLKDKMKYLVFLTATISFYDVFLLDKRSPAAVMIIATIAFFFNRIYLGYITTKQLFKPKYIITIIAIFAIIAIFSSEVLYQQIDRFSWRFTNGVSDMINGTNTDASGSAIARYYARQRAFDFLWDMNIIQHIIGAGYNSIGQLDIPFFQCYLEMGILGLLIFICIYKPLFQFYKSDNILLFACLYGFFAPITSFNGGTPYSFLEWLPISFFTFVMKNKTFYNANNRSLIL